MCWGSFLNALSYRLIKEKSILTPRSFCPHCHTTLAWYDLIPVASWVWLGGHCRVCKKSISLLYPIIELLTPLVMIPLVLWLPFEYFFGYFIFFSALIITIRSDIETMLISRFVTLFLIPIGIGCSYLDFIPLTTTHSILGIIVGYGFLYCMATIFKYLTGKEGMGQGDVELLAFIGSYTGVLGCWVSLLLGSISGSLFGMAYLLVTRKKKSVKIPFGPFLALGAIAYVLFQETVTFVLLDF